MAEGGDAELVAQFVSVTGASADEAKRFLHSSGGALEQAINLYFGALPRNKDVGAVPISSFTKSSFCERAEGETPTDESLNHEQNPSPTQPTQAPPPQTQQPQQPPAQRSQRLDNNVTTLNDVGDSGNDPQQYFAGGGKSGMLVEGNDDSDAGGGDRVQGLFEKARQAGAEQGSEDDLLPEHQSGRSGFSAFTGSARSLSGAAESRQHGDNSAPQQQQQQQQQERVHNIVFYRNGFVVDDGELRSLSDPANADFLESLKKGQYPRELVPSDPNHPPVRVNLMRKDEEYTAPEQPKYKAFQGQARTLASDVGASSSSDQSRPSMSGAKQNDSGEWHVDESQHVVKVQLRLTDGSRLIGRFNATHTVADIYRFIRTVRPDRNPQALQLYGMPPKPLDDLAQTVIDAGAAGGVVMER
jgi:UBX domain-containing protein 1